VWLEAVVGTDGRVGDVRVTQSLDREHGLDEEAIRTVRQWQFAPGRRDGAPVPVVVDLQLSFVLRK
jgi:periplasmic protein TonB